jgi:CO/xanthine dehydrogenase FAD-binding subunit
LRWPTAEARAGYGFRELSVRAGDYAIVAVACIVEVRHDGRLTRVRLGFGGCGETPQVIEPAGAAGQVLDDELAARIARDAADSIVCRGDLQATADYRRHLAGLLGRQVLADARAGSAPA